MIPIKEVKHIGALSIEIFWAETAHPSRNRLRAVYQLVDKETIHNHTYGIWPNSTVVTFKSKTDLAVALLSIDTQNV